MADASGDPAASRCRVWACAAIVLVVGAALAAETGCVTHQCDSSQVAWSGGEMIDANTYETGPLDAPWLPYDPNETLMVTYPDAVRRAIAGRPAAWVEPYVGTGPTPNLADNGNWTPATGQLALLNFFGPNGFWVTNGSCASNYFLRVIVHYTELGEAGPSDGSAGRASDTVADSGADGVTISAAADAASEDAHGQLP